MSENLEQTAERRGVLEVLTGTRLPLWASLLLAALLIVVFAWQRVAVNRAEARLAAERQEMTQRFEAERTALTARLKEFALGQEQSALTRFGTALAWAVRGELIRNNLDQVDQYFAELVRMPRVHRVVLAGQDGKVLVATDRKFLGQPVTELHPAGVLTTLQVDVQATAQGSRLVIPVMGLNARLGTVVVEYGPLSLPAGL
ncbi:MAG: hypothetical protein ACK4TK_10540 [Thiobacillaceae bacterium]